VSTLHVRKTPRRKPSTRYRRLGVSHLGGSSAVAVQHARRSAQIGKPAAPPYVLRRPPLRITAPRAT
jgi:hypothetical protein